MTTAGIEIEYWYSAQERLRAKNLLGELATNTSKSGRSSSALNYLMPVAVIYLGYEVFLWLNHLLKEIHAGNWTELLTMSEIFSYIMGFIFILVIVQCIWPLLYQVATWVTATRRGHKGVNWGDVRLSATPEKLTIEMALRRTTYPWEAFTDLTKTKDMLVLMLAPLSAVFIPRRVFTTPADEDTFCAFLENHINAG